MEDLLIESLRAGATLVTASARLARASLSEYDCGMHGSGGKVWATADILPLSGWLRRCWEQLLYRPGGEKLGLLLRPSQQHAVWEEIVRLSSASHQLLQTSSTAAAAADAWNLLHAWRLSPDAAEWHDSRESEVFSAWRESFEQRCLEHGWVSPAQLPDLIASALRGRDLAAPARLWLAGFQEFTPQQKELIEALRAAGCDVQFPDGARANAGDSAVCTGLADREQEIRRAAQWARRQLESNPDCSIGVVLPDLRAVRAKVERIFTAALHPSALLPGRPARNLTFNISLGLPLLDYPLIQAAFVALEAARDPLPLETASRLLRSPFFAGALEEQASRARIDRELRRYRCLEVSMEDILNTASKSSRGEKKTASPVLFRRVRRWVKELKAQPGAQQPSEWAAGFSRLLHKLGWPGDRPFNSTEHQTFEKWHDLLDEFAGLDIAERAMSYGEALAALRRLAAEMLFQPESGEAPIQILGLLETSGLRFDHLWVMGLEDRVWPLPPSPNPFLPISLQRDANLPHSSAAREHEFSRLTIERLCASAGQVVFSYPRRDNDVDLQPSPVLRSFPEADAESIAPVIAPTYFSWLRGGAALTSVQDDIGPPLPDPWLQLGGSRVLQAQAACPFQAFANYRLGVKRPDKAQPGLDMMDRGNILHSVLQEVWRQLESHSRLSEMAPRELHRLVEDTITETLRRESSKRPALSRARLQSIERQRLKNLVLDWLAYEKTRAPFRVLHRETESNVTFGGLRLKLRMDRVDELHDGRHVLIDYKSGDTNLNNWEGDRPDQPQLPLYALTSELNLGAVLFAQIKRGDLAFKGFSHVDGIVPEVAPPEMGWQPQLDEWRLVLERLAADFRGGYAAVDPKLPKDTCRFCGLTALCRVTERNTQLDLKYREATVE
jgi:probable DNA repair protein